MIFVCQFMQKYSNYQIWLQVVCPCTFGVSWYLYLLRLKKTQLCNSTVFLESLVKSHRKIGFLLIAVNVVPLSKQFCSRQSSTNHNVQNAIQYENSYMLYLPVKMLLCAYGSPPSASTLSLIILPVGLQWHPGFMYVMSSLWQTTWAFPFVCLAKVGCHATAGHHEITVVVSVLFRLLQQLLHSLLITSSRLI